MIVNNQVAYISFLIEIETMETHSPVTGHCIDHSAGNDYPADPPAGPDGARNEC